ncbi:MAG: hypothetical protein IAE65_10570 [Ignavibacteria bacterium]|nr:hypothetical protein [Ignavibacteria bacterium]
MKTFLKIILFVTVIALMAGSCSSINELPKYNLSGKKFLFKSNFKNIPPQVQVNVSADRKRNKNGVIEDVFYEAGAFFVVSEVENKLRKVYNSDSVCYTLTESIESILTTYRDIEIVQDVSENPDFIVETNLDKFVISAGSYGVYSNFSAVITIYDRKTAKKIWERSESISEPLVEEYYFGFPYYNPYSTRKGNVGYKETTRLDYNRVISLYMLMSMTEEEIKSAINYTTALVAQDLANDLRDDLSAK